MNPPLVTSTLSSDLEAQRTFLEGLYEQRLLVFVEDSSLSNKYRQVILKPEQFKKISDAVAGVFPSETKDGFETIQLCESTAVYNLPDLQSSYT